MELVREVPFPQKAVGARVDENGPASRLGLCLSGGEACVQGEREGKVVPTR